MIAVDGTQIREVLARVGAAATPSAAAIARVAELERWIGQRLPAETSELLSRLPRLHDPDVGDHPGLALDFYAGLPDVEAFLDRLASELDGPLLATCQFFGLVPLSARLDRGDYTVALAAIDGYAGGRLGGVFYFDEREIGRLAPTASQWLLDELRAFREAAAGGDLYDCYRLDVDPTAPLPDIAPMPAAITEAFAAHAEPRTDGRDRWWICAALRGEIASWALDALPTPERWERERHRVARLHGDATYWLLAHAILGNRAELADTIDRSRANPSRLVAVLRDHLLDHPDFSDRFRDFRAALYDLARAR